MRATDEELLSARDARSFEEFYVRHVPGLLAYFSAPDRDAELSADLTSETFAAALAGRRRFKPDAGAASAWLYGIASRKLADAHRRGYADRRMQKRLGMERVELSDADIEHILALGVSEGLLEGLPEQQREAVEAHVIHDRGYDQIAVELDTSEAVVRKRVSRGLATARRLMGRQR